MLDAFINEDCNRLVWGLRIEADSLNSELSNSISFEAETLLSTKPYQIERWDELDGTEIEWVEAEDDEGEAIALLYLFDFTPVYNATIQFIKNSEQKLFVKIKATCDLRWKESYSDGLELIIESPVLFQNILMNRSSEKECWEMINNYFDNAENLFKYKQDEYGVSTLV